MQEPRPPYTTRRPAVIAGVVAIALTAALGLLIAARSQLDLDQGWMSDVVGWRTPAGEAFSRLFDFLGGGWFAIFAVPIGVGLIFWAVRRPWSGLTFVLASAVAAGLCQLMKAGFGRARPQEILLPLDNGSFPSGHTTNAAVIAVTLALLLNRAWIWWVGGVYVIVMAFTRTYLGAHWLTDTLGGTLLGIGSALLVWCAMQPLVRRETERAQRSDPAPA